MISDTCPGWSEESSEGIVKGDPRRHTASARNMRVPVIPQHACTALTHRNISGGGAYLLGCVLEAVEGARRT